jgi:predicted nucleic acid-binding protein
MTPAVVLDSGPLGLLTLRRRKSTEADACRLWLDRLLEDGVRVYVPEIADYEARRELLRIGKAAGVARLDALKVVLHFVPITTPTMLLAADLWAQTRRAGLPTAAREALDADVILAAQAITLNLPELVVATGNTAHIGRFVTAAAWHEITP